MKDYCGTCGEPLRESPSGGRYACHPADARYWTPHKPLAEDARGHYQISGREQRVQTACKNSAGEIVRHAPLYLYRAP